MVTIVKRIGNSTVTLHSPSGVIFTDAEEKQQWFRRELKRGNPVVQRIAELASEIYIRSASQGQ